MLIVAGEIRMRPGTRHQFLTAVAPMVAASVVEPGCRAYAFTPDPDDDDLLRLYELWDDEAALAGHARSEHMAAWRERGRDLPVVSRDLQVLTIADARPLRDAVARRPDCRQSGNWGRLRPWARAAFDAW
jgi:quinol monooxygenase YgiN